MLYYFDPTQSYFFINETASLMNHVSFGTIIPCIGGEVQDNVSRLVKITENLHILGSFGGLRPTYNFKTTSHVLLYIYTNEIH